MKTVTVIVLNWNGLADTRAVLPTLARSRMPEGWLLRVMVVDNGSTDGSAEAIPREFPDVEFVALTTNRRFAGGNNEGLRRAIARADDAIMLLNNDTEADPGMLEHLILALEQEPDFGAVAPLIYFGAPSQRIWYAGGRCIPALGHASHRFILPDHAPVQPLFHVHQLLDFALQQPRHRDAGPLGHHLGDVLLIHLFLQHAALELDLGEPRVLLLKLTLDLQ